VNTPARANPRAPRHRGTLDGFVGVQLVNHSLAVRVAVRVLRPSHDRDIVAAVALDASADTPHYRRSVTAPRSLLCDA